MTQRDSTTVVDLLDRPTYTMAQVDGLLGLSPGTARRWIDGYERAGRWYQPVVRVRSSGDELVTWGEFVETRLLAEYRDANVPMAHMRPVVERLRDQLGVRYPLAHERPFAAGRELMGDLQDELDLDVSLWIVLRTGQVTMGSDLDGLAPPAHRFYESVEWDSGVARGVFPDGRASVVTIWPDRAFGEPSVHGVRTDVIAEEVFAGDPVGFVADGFDLSVSEVSAAVRFETRRQGRKFDLAVAS